jgi:molybdopterin-containing oxidoreductase family membrane subunit
MGYPAEGADKRLLESLFYGQYAWLFWGMAIVGLFIPALLLALPWTRTMKGIVTASILINIGMWVKRYVIVVPTLASPFVPVVAPVIPLLSRSTGKALNYMVPLNYAPTWVEWGVTAGAFSGFCMLYLLFSKIFPIVSIWEVENHDHSHAPAAESVPAASGVQA